MPYLIYNDGTTQEAVLLDSYPVFRIGRTSNNEMTILEDPSVSREHCQIIRQENGSFIIRDLESRNGTYINDGKIASDPVILNDGDKITVGSKTELIYCFEIDSYANTETKGIAKVELPSMISEASEEELVQTSVLKKIGSIDKEKALYKSMPDSALIAPGSIICGHEISKSLGRGQFATVYVAFQKSVGRTVSLKMFNNDYKNQEALSLFQKHIPLVGRLQHPNIIQSFDSGLWQNHPFITMTYIPDSSLSDKIAKSFPLDELFVLQIIRKVAAALKYALDEHGIIHLNLNSKNILFTDSDEPVVADLGISTWLALSYQTNRRSFLGNPAYMSPEQALDQLMDWRADLYSLGIVFYECLAGRPPFSADSTYNLITKHRTEEITFPKQLIVSQEIKNIIQTMTAKQPQDRYRNWELFIKAVDGAIASIGRSLHTPGPAAVPRPVPPPPSLIKKGAPPLKLKHDAAPQRKMIIPAKQGGTKLSFKK